MIITGCFLVLLALFLLSCTSKETATNTTSEAVTAAAVQEATPTLPETSTEPTAEPATTIEPVTEPASEPAAEPVEEIAAPGTEIPLDSGETYVVNLIDGGFEVPEITIKAGDTIVWQNVREKHPTKAMIVAVQPCAKVKSSVFLPGSTFKWKFEEPVRCTIVDGIFTTQAMKVIVE